LSEILDAYMSSHPLINPILKKKKKKNELFKLNIMELLKDIYIFFFSHFFFT